MGTLWQQQTLTVMSWDLLHSSPLKQEEVSESKTFDLSWLSRGPREGLMYGSYGKCQPYVLPATAGQDASHRLAH